MTWTHYRYADLSDAYTVTWTDAKDKFHAALRGNPHYAGAVGNYATNAAAKTACANHDKELAA